MSGGALRLLANGEPAIQLSADWRGTAISLYDGSRGALKLGPGTLKLTGAALAGNHDDGIRLAVSPDGDVEASFTEDGNVFCTIGKSDDGRGVMHLSIPDDAPQAGGK
jgi:hypothetical protein